MKLLRTEIDGLWRSAAKLPASSGGRTLMVMSARSGEGVSSVAASFAILAASRSPRSTWLVDLDLRRNTQFEAFNRGFAGRGSTPGRAYDASLNQPPFYAISPTIASQGGKYPNEKLLTVHRVGESKLMVSRFRSDRLKAGQRVQLKSQPSYWQAVRAAADWTVIDAPALEKSGAGLIMAGQCDGVALVVQADQTRQDEVIGLRREIEDHGGRCIGIVFNGIGADARLADKFSL